MNKLKICKGCFSELPLNCFGVCTKNHKTYYYARCKKCCRNNVKRETQSEEDVKNGYKTCVKCKLIKGLSHFSFDRNHKIFRTKCKGCKNAEYTPVPYQHDIDIKNGYKICTKCKIKQDLSQYGRPKSRKGSFYPHCNKCRAKYVTNRLHTNIQFRLKQVMSVRIYQALKNKNFRKNNRTMELIGCDIPYLIKHLEQKFSNGMSWDNYGEWHVDHIKPCISFDLTNEEEQRKCFNYTNLQPLWAFDNLSKGGKV